MVLIKTLRGIASQIAQPIALAIGIDLPETCPCWRGEVSTLWSEPTNWNNEQVPLITDLVIFESGFSNPCNIDVDISVLGIRIESGYTSTVTQNAGQTIGLGVRGLVQENGTFVGGDSVITNTGSHMQSGGTFTSTSDTYLYAGSSIFTVAGIFNHNNGTFENTAAAGFDLDMNGEALNNWTTNNSNQNTNVILLSDVQTDGLLHIVKGRINAAVAAVVNVKGDIKLGTTQSSTNTLSSRFVINGTAAQKIYVDEIGGTSISACAPISVNKSAGTLTIKDNITIRNSSGTKAWSHTLGTVDATTSKLTFGGFAWTWDDGTSTLYDLVWDHGNTSVLCTLAANVNASNSIDIQDGKIASSGFDITAPTITTDRDFLDLVGTTITCDDFTSDDCDLKATANWFLVCTNTAVGNNCDVSFCQSTNDFNLTNSTDSGNNSANVNFI